MTDTGAHARDRPHATRCIALLRGVNVGGITVKSAELAELFRELGFERVKTVLASGNVAFDAPATGDARAGADADARAGLKARVEKALATRFGYDAWIVLVTQDELGAIAAAYPFERDDDVLHPYVVFGSDEAVLDELVAAAAALEPVDGTAVETLGRTSGAVFWRVRKGDTLASPFGKLIARTRYKSTTTTRNLRTVEKLLAV